MLLLTLLLSGGLLSYPERTLGPELQRNGGFENGLEDWSARDYKIDMAVFRSGRAALRLTGADSLPYAQSAVQSLPGKSVPAYYRVSAWIKTQDLGSNGKGKGVRLGLKAKEARGQARCERGCGYSRVLSGTRDWFHLEVGGIYITDSSDGLTIGLDAYGDPSGTYWIDDVVVQEEVSPPLSVVLRVPNYRGILWSDQPLAAEFDVGQSQKGAITAVVSQAGNVQQTHRVEAGRVRIDLAEAFGARTSGAVEVAFQLDGRSAFPPFRLVRRSAAERDGMSATFSPDGRFLVRGRPTFFLGVYDSGLGYTESEAGWEAGFAEKRRLFELKGLNAYINYWFGNTPTAALQAMMAVLSNRKIQYWQTANCFGDARYGSGTGFLSTGADPSYAAKLGKHAGLGGFYLADECRASLADEVMADHLLLQERQDGGVNLGIFNKTALAPWVPSADAIGVDLYPMYGSEKAGGYPFGVVYDGAVAVRQVVGERRPFVQVIQFYKSTARGRWPTREELRSMSYAAVVGGANGLFYWSLGTNALAYVCRGWCPEKVDYFERLRSVIAELSELKALANEDLPNFKVAVSDNAIKVRVKKGSSPNQYHVVAYNHSPRARSTTFSLGSEARTVSVDGGAGRRVAVVNRRFDDSFGPWAAHVYDVR